MVDNLDATESRFYFYDERDRLSRATDISATDLFTYSYDAAGNRLSKTNAAGTTTYTYETGTDRLQDATGAEAAYHAHDAYGNRIYAGTTPYTGTPNYTYNDQNRLVLAANTAGGAPVPAVYDAFGRRVFWMLWVFVYDQSGRILEVSNRDGSPDVPPEYGSSQRGHLGGTDACEPASSAFGDLRRLDPGSIPDGSATPIRRPLSVQGEGQAGSGSAVEGSATTWLRPRRLAS